MVAHIPVTQRRAIRRTCSQQRSAAADEHSIAETKTVSLMTRENLMAALESLSQNGNFAAANRAMGARSTGTIWRYLAKAKIAKEANDREVDLVSGMARTSRMVRRFLRSRPCRAMRHDGRLGPIAECTRHRKHLL